MPPTQANFASLGFAPLVLRLLLGATFLWSGTGKWMGTMNVQGENAAILANLDVIQRTAPAAPPASNPPAQPLPSSDGAAPAPASAPGTLLIFAQSSPAAPTRSLPVTAGLPLATAADFPEPVACRKMWGIALSIHHAAFPKSEPGTPARRSLWPAVLAEGLWPKAFAIAVFVSEVAAGVLLLIGLFTRLAALSCAGIMLGAIWLTQIGPAIQSGKTQLGFLPDHNPWDSQAWMPLGWQLSLLSASLALAALGCGVLAADRALAGYRAVPERFQRTTPPTPPGAPRG